METPYKHYNEEAEKVVLTHILNEAEDGNRALLTQVKPDWFWIPKNKLIIEIMLNKPSPMKIMEIWEVIQANRIEYVSMDYLLDTVGNLDIHRSFEDAKDIIEHKYLQRKVAEKLKDIQDKIYITDLKDLQAELMQYFYNLGVQKEQLKSIYEDYKEINEELLDVGTARDLYKLSPLRKTIMVLGGDSAHHKTNQCIDILIQFLKANYSKNPKFKVLFFSAEMAFDRIRDRLFAKILHQPLQDIKSRKRKPQEILSEVKAKAPYLDNFIIVPPTQFTSLTDVSTLLTQFKPDVWGFDFLQYFAYIAAGGKQQDQNRCVMETIATLKVLSEITNSLGIIISQVRKKSENRERHFPRIDDLEWSGLTKQIADNIGMCFWPVKVRKEYGTMGSRKIVDASWYCVSWQKVRDGSDFTEALKVTPEYCDFSKHPTPNVGAPYLDF